MKITISEIPAGGLDIEVADEIHIDSVNLTGPARGRLVLEMQGSELRVRGRVAAAAQVACSRCLAPYAFYVDAEIDLVYQPAAPGDKSEHIEIHPDELDVGYYSGDCISTEEILQEQIILAMPIKPLCSPACKGICPSCGVDLNEQDCRCRTDGEESLFSVLKNLKRDKE